MYKDNNDPVLFNSLELETANMTVLHCREVLEQTGMTENARRLEGIEVTDPQMASVALEVLQSMRVKAEAAYSRDLAISNLKHALRC
jgi:DICT domain-containing protein